MIRFSKKTDMGTDVATHHTGRKLESILLSDQHLHQITPARDQGSQFTGGLRLVG